MYEKQRNVGTKIGRQEAILFTLDIIHMWGLPSAANVLSLLNILPPVLSVSSRRVDQYLV